MSGDLYILITPEWASAANFTYGHIWYHYPITNRDIKSIQGAFLQFAADFISRLDHFFDSPKLHEISYRSTFSPINGEKVDRGVLLITHEHARSLEEFEFAIQLKEIKPKHLSQFLTHDDKVLRDFAKETITPNNLK